MAGDSEHAETQGDQMRSSYKQPLLTGSKDKHPATSDKEQEKEAETQDAQEIASSDSDNDEGGPLSKPEMEIPPNLKLKRPSLSFKDIAERSIQQGPPVVTKPLEFARRRSVQRNSILGLVPPVRSEDEEEKGTISLIPSFEFAHSDKAARPETKEEPLTKASGSSAAVERSKVVNREIEEDNGREDLCSGDMSDGAAASLQMLSLEAREGHNEQREKLTGSQL